jgi:hypothetical protein
MCGYCWAALVRTERPVTPELMRFHRREQMAKLRTIVGSLVRMRRIDKFHLNTSEKKLDSSKDTIGRVAGL